MNLSPGDRVGRFEVEALLGEGGLAEVYLVRHSALGGHHALKLLTWRRKSLAERLLLEGRIQAQLRHPNIVAVTDVIRHEGQVGLLMEYVDGIPLEMLIEQRGSLEIDEAVELFASILAGMTTAHDAGVLHRDLKPANILLARKSSSYVPKITDFGIAKMIREDLVQSHSTGVGQTMGTPGYMAPEQITDASDVDARADVFSLAVILYELLAGRRAFANEHGIVELKSTLEMTPEPLGELVPDADERLCAAVMRALSRDREDRQANARELAEEALAGYPQLLARVTTLSEAREISVDSSRETLDVFKATPTPAPSLDEQLPSAPPPQTTTPTLSPDSTATRVGFAVIVVVVAVVASAVGTAVMMWSQSTGQVAQQQPPSVPVPSSIAVEPTAQPAPEGTTSEEEEAEPPGEEGEPEHDGSEDPGDDDETASAAEPPPRPSAAPEPTPSTEPEPTPSTEPEPTPSEPEPTPSEPEPTPTAKPEPERQVIVVSQPDPEPEPVVAATAPEPPPVPQPVEDRTDELRGTWTGTANNRPFTLNLATASKGTLHGQATFVLGPSQRRVPVQGTFDSEALALRLEAEDGSFRFTGTYDGSGIEGTYLQGNRSREFAWSVSR